MSTWPRSLRRADSRRHRSRPRRRMISPSSIFWWSVSIAWIKRLGRRRATRRVHVDGHDLVDTLHDRIVVEHAAGAGAHAHRDDPLGLHHLVVHLTQHRRHLLADPTGDDHDVGLTRRRAEDLHPEAGDVVVRGAGRHHLDRAAGETERGRPRRARPRPVDQVFELAGDGVVGHPADAIGEHIIDDSHPCLLRSFDLGGRLERARPSRPTRRMVVDESRSADTIAASRSRLRYECSGPHSRPPRATS